MSRRSARVGVANVTVITRAEIQGNVLNPLYMITDFFAKYKSNSLNAPTAVSLELADDLKTIETRFTSAIADFAEFKKLLKDQEAVRRNGSNGMNGQVDCPMVIDDDLPVNVQPAPRFMPRSVRRVNDEEKKIHRVIRALRARRNARNPVAQPVVLLPVLVNDRNPEDQKSSSEQQQMDQGIRNRKPAKTMDYFFTVMLPESIPVPVSLPTRPSVRLDSQHLLFITPGQPFLTSSFHSWILNLPIEQLFDHVMKLAMPNYVIDNSARVLNTGGAGGAGFYNCISKDLDFLQKKALGIHRLPRVAVYLRWFLRLACEENLRNSVGILNTWKYVLQMESFFKYVDYSYVESTKDRLKIQMLVLAHTLNWCNPLWYRLARVVNLDLGQSLFDVFGELNLSEQQIKSLTQERLLNIMFQDIPAYRKQANAEPLNARILKEKIVLLR